MPTITKKDFEQMLDKRINPLGKTLAQAAETLHRTTALLTHIVEDVAELKTDMKTVRETLDSHTISLDKTLKNTETWKAESAAINTRFERHEQWIKQMAEKLNIKLES